MVKDTPFGKFIDPRMAVTGTLAMLGRVLSGANEPFERASPTRKEAQTREAKVTITADCAADYTDLHLRSAALRGIE